MDRSSFGESLPLHIILPSGKNVNVSVARHREACELSAISRPLFGVVRCIGLEVKASRTLVLRFLVEGKRSLQLSRELPSNASLMHAMVNDLVQQTLSAMAQRVPLAAIVAKIFDDHADSNLGEFRHIIMSMLDTTRYDVRIHEAVRDLEKADAHALREAHVAKQKRGVLVCVEIKSSTRLQCARMRSFRREAFCCASRTR